MKATTTFSSDTFQVSVTRHRREDMPGEMAFEIVASQIGYAPTAGGSIWCETEDDFVTLAEALYAYMEWTEKQSSNSQDNGGEQSE